MRKQCLLALGGTLLFPLLSSPWVFAQHDAHRPWSSPEEAGWLYWLLAALVIGGLFLFALWALYWRGKEPEKPSTGRYHALGSLVVVMTLFTLALYLIVAFQAQSTPPSARAWDWTPGETLADPGGTNLSGEPYRGYDVFLAQGCTYCHTLYLRPEDVVTGWGEGAKAEDVSQIGDFVNFPYALLGTQRDGPDLTLIGRKIPDMTYQMEHLRDPRKFKPKSVMPTYGYLSDRDLRDLAAFLVSLGNLPAELKAGQVKQPEPTTQDAAVQLGQSLYRSLGCVGCHTADGSASAGPTWKELFGKTETLADGSTALVDEAYLIESILAPGEKVVQNFGNFMPPYPQLSQEQLDRLVAYIKSLGGQ